MYMKRQMIAAPTNEMAIGRKMRDLATFSPLARSARTAMPRPNAVEIVVTTTTHQMLLKMVPRTVDSTAHDMRKKPKTRAPSRLRCSRSAGGCGVRSKTPARMPTSTMPMAM